MTSSCSPHNAGRLMMKSSTDVKQSTAPALPEQGIYIDLFNDFRHPATNAVVQANGVRAGAGECDDCDCECAPQCPDCGPSF